MSAETVVVKTGQPVDVYRNLKTAELFSIRDRKTGIVLTKETGFFLTQVTPVISPRGQQRVRANKQRHVHCVLRGEFGGHGHLDVTGMEEVYYNPYTTDTFILRNTNIPYTGNHCIYFAKGKAWLVPKSEGDGVS